MNGFFSKKNYVSNKYNRDKLRIKVEIILLLKKYIEDITRRREDMTFIFEWSKHAIFYERAQRVSKILFLTRELKIKVISSSHRVMTNVLFII
jgi:hypothetical protein